MLLDGKPQGLIAEAPGFAVRARAIRDDAKAAISVRGRNGLGRMFADLRSGARAPLRLPLAVRGLMTAMASGFQPRMAFGFEGEIQFEITIPTASRTTHSSEWWTLEVEGERAVARRRAATDPVVTIHAGIADFIRVGGGQVNQVGLWAEKRSLAEGDILIGQRVVELFGGESLDVVA